ncbi:MAG: metal ABC transporter substrate-binding protein [Burkholderiaceae bacterium]
MRIRSSRFIPRCVIALIGFGLSCNAAALTVFACEPEWAALVGELAPNAKVISATHARQDPHYVEARPSLIARLRHADLAICTGAELESGWLPLLQQRASNPKVSPGRPGLLLASEHVTLIHQMPQADRSHGHVHPEGNPHIHLDPSRLSSIAAVLARRLGQIDPAGVDAYQTRYKSWLAQWEQDIAALEELAAPLRGRSLVAQHSSFAYLWEWLGLMQSADLEPKPGLPPTPSHLAKVVQLANERPPIAIVQTLYQDTAPARWLHKQTGVPWKSLPSTVTSDGASSTLRGLFDTLIRELLEAANELP